MKQLIGYFMALAGIVLAGIFVRDKMVVLVVGLVFLGLFLLLQGMGEKK